MRNCCVAGSGEITVDEKAREMRVKGQVFKEGDWISLDGTTGRVIKGKLNTIDPKGDVSDALATNCFMDECDDRQRSPFYALEVCCYGNLLLEARM